jgi:hypothetical protein
MHVRQPDYFTSDRTLILMCDDLAPIHGDERFSVNRGEMLMTRPPGEEYIRPQLTPTSLGPPRAVSRPVTPDS